MDVALNQVINWGGNHTQSYAFPLFFYPEANRYRAIQDAYRSIWIQTEPKGRKSRNELEQPIIKREIRIRCELCTYTQTLKLNVFPSLISVEECKQRRPAYTQIYPDLTCHRCGCVSIICKLWSSYSDANHPAERDDCAHNCIFPSSIAINEHKQTTSSTQPGLHDLIYHSWSNVGDFIWPLVLF